MAPLNPAFNPEVVTRRLPTCHSETCDYVDRPHHKLEEGCVVHRHPACPFACGVGHEVKGRAKRAGSPAPQVLPAPSKWQHREHSPATPEAGAGE